MAARPLHRNIAPLAQLDRASGYEPEGREFESLRAHHYSLHVMTVYSVENVPHNVADGINTSAVQQEFRYTIEERFSDFQTDNGITLPRRYDLQYTEELQTGQTRLYDWDMTADKIQNNVNPDPSNFRSK